MYMGKKAEILKIRLNDVLSRFSNEIIFIREKHALEDTFFVSEKTHSVTNTEDFLIHDILKKYATTVIDKTRYSALYNTELENLLMIKKIKNVTLIGVETHTSILFTAEELKNRNYNVTVIEPCVMSKDDHMHDFALSLMRHFLGVKITNG